MLLPQLLMLLPQLLLPLPLLPMLLLLPLLLAQSAPSSRLRMSSATLLMDTRTSTLPSKNKETPTEESLDLTPMLMRLESTLSTMLLMTSDSVLPETTFQLPLSTTLLSQSLQSTLLPQLLIPLRSLRPGLLSSLLSRLKLPEPRDLLSLVPSAQLLMLVLPLVSSPLPLPLPVRPSLPPSS